MELLMASGDQEAVPAGWCVACSREEYCCTEWRTGLVLARPMRCLVAVVALGFVL